MGKKLIVNADDFGNSSGVSEGILKAHLDGIVTSTTAMMNMPGAGDQVRLAVSRCPDLGMGVHLVLSEGSPLLPLDEVKTITAGKSEFPDPDGLLARVGQIDFGEVEKEWSAQIEAYTLAAGRPPDHLDAHHYVSNMHPDLLRITLKLAERYGCAVRAACLVLDESDQDNPPVAYNGNLAELKKMLSVSKVPHPQYFQHSFYDEADCSAVLNNVLANLPEGITELMVHPGFVDEDLLRRSSYNVQREKELAALTRSGLRDWLLENGVELINYSILS